MSMLTVQRPCTGSNLFVPTVNTSFPYLSGYSLPGLAGTGNSLHGWKARNSTSQRVCNQCFGRKIQSQGFPLPGRLIGGILVFYFHSKISIRQATGVHNIRRDHVQFQYVGASRCNFFLSFFSSYPEVLSQGSSPLAFLDEHIKNYVECVKKPDKEGCSSILNPPERTSSKSGDKKPGKQFYFETNRHYA